MITKESSGLKTLDNTRPTHTLIPDTAQSVHIVFGRLVLLVPNSFGCSSSISAQPCSTALNGIIQICCKRCQVSDQSSNPHA